MSKTIKHYAIYGLIISGLIVLGVFYAHATNIKDRLQNKASHAQERVKALAAQGKNVVPIITMMKQVPNIVQREGPLAAEAYLETIHEKIDALQKNETSNTLHTHNLEPSGLFSEEKPVEMIGYDGHIMELFLSRDDRILFFNNLNDPSVNTNIHYAKRLDKDRFQYLGEVKGINTQSLEGVPALDNNGFFYFISPRRFKQTHSTIYTGTYKDGVVSDVRIVKGNINGRKPPFFNMGVEISADGQTLYYTESIGQKGGGPPKDSNIKFGIKKQDAFFVAQNSDVIMQHINTPDELEYAISISSDELTMFFNRSKMLIEGNQTVGADLKILIAQRKRKTDPFGKPKILETVQGFVEGAAITSDGKTLYYHKKNKDGIFRIYYVEHLDQ